MAKKSARRESRPQVKDEARRQETSDDRSSVATMEAGPGPEAIARRAYEIYCERGYLDGRAMDDWLQAESELKGRRSNSGLAG